MNKPNIFLDFGYYAGNIQKYYRDINILDDTWLIYSFDPNPDLDLPKEVIKKAVWIKDGTVEFEIAGREDAASITGMTGHTEPKKVKVPSIDISKFVGNLPDGYIICSMDIEGAEFPVLKKMLKDHTIDKIDVLDIEFHHRFMADKTKEDAEKLIKQIKARGPVVKLKVPLE